MHDWNHNGKIDRQDRRKDYYIYNELKKEKSERKSRAIEENTENHNLPEESTDGCAGGIVVMGGGGEYCLFYCFCCFGR